MFDDWQKQLFWGLSICFIWAVIWPLLKWILKKAGDFGIGFLVRTREQEQLERARAKIDLAYRSELIIQATYMTVRGMIYIVLGIFGQILPVVVFRQQIALAYLVQIILVITLFRGILWYGRATSLFEAAQDARKLDDAEFRKDRVSPPGQ